MTFEWKSAVAPPLAFAGWTNVEARREEGVAEVRVTIPRAELDKEPLQVVTMAVQHIPGERAHGRFELDVGSDQSRIVEGPLAPFMVSPSGEPRDWLAAFATHCRT